MAQHQDSALPTGLTPATEEGVGMLRTFQLRKENAALLAKIEASAQAIQAYTAENSRFSEEIHERVAAIEAKISELERGEKRDRKAIEDWGVTVRTLRRTIDGIVRTPTTNVIPTTQDMSRNLIKALPVSVREPIVQIESDSAMIMGVNPEQIPFNDLNPSDTNIGIPQQPLITGITNCITNLRGTTRHKSQNQVVRSTPQPRTLRSRQIEIYNALDSQPPPTQGLYDPRTKSQAAKLQPIKLPRLAQGTGQLKTYFVNATKAFETVAKDRATEVEFVAAFLKGLRERKQRDLLFNKMKSVHPCRTGPKGFEIVCKWEDVGDALRDAKLVESDETELPVKKKRKMLIPMDD